MTTRKLLKTVHTLGSIGMGGGMVAYLVLISYGPEPALTATFVEFREGIYALTRFVIMPSMVLVFMTGLFAMAVHYPFQNRWWVWIKAGSGLLVFEAVLASIDAPARRTAEALRGALDEGIGTASVDSLIVEHRGALWALLALIAVNVILGVWRPRFSRKESD